MPSNRSARRRTGAPGRQRKRVLGCLASSCAVLAGLTLALFGHASHQAGVWGVWKKSTNRVAPAVRSLAVEPGVLFAGTEGAGVFRSIDGGLTWMPFSRGLPNAQVLGLFAVPGAGEVYAAGPAGLLRSPTDRSDWAPVGEMEDCSAIVGISHGFSPAVLLALCDGKLFRSAGDLWTEAPAPSAETLLQLWPPPKNRGDILLLGAQSLWRSGDAGLNWERIVSTPPSDAELRESWEARNGMQGWPHFLVTDASRPEWVYAGTESGFALSRDSGRTWIPAEQGLEDAFAILQVVRSGTRLFAATDHRTTLVSEDEGRTWRSSGVRHPVSFEDSLAVRASEPCQILLSHVYLEERSADCGATWTKEEAPVPVRNLTSSGGDSPVVYALATNERTLLRSPDFGRTWQPVLRGTIGRIAMDPLDSRHLYAAGIRLQLGPRTLDGIAESLDEGRTWRLIEFPFMQPLRISALVPSRTVPGRLLAGTDDGAWRFSRGTGWVRLYRKQGEIHDLFEEPGRPGRLYVCMENGIFGSEDDGRSWVEIRHPPEDCRRLLPVEESALLMVTEAQAYRLERHPGWWMALWVIWRLVTGSEDG